VGTTHRKTLGTQQLLEHPTSGKRLLLRSRRRVIQMQLINASNQGQIDQRQLELSGALTH
jgi:hypothetical protein